MHASSNLTSSLPQSSSTFPNLSNQSDTYRIEEPETFRYNKGDIADWFTKYILGERCESDASSNLIQDNMPFFQWLWTKSSFLYHQLFPYTGPVLPNLIICSSLFVDWEFSKKNIVFCNYHCGSESGEGQRGASQLKSFLTPFFLWFRLRCMIETATVATVIMGHYYKTHVFAYRGRKDLDKIYSMALSIR